MRSGSKSGCTRTGGKDLRLFEEIQKSSEALVCSGEILNPERVSETKAENNSQRLLYLDSGQLKSTVSQRSITT